MELRDYQKLAISNTYDAIKEGKKRIILASCTGSGKTVVMAKIAADAATVGKKILIVVDDSPLIPQTLDKLRRFGLDAGVIKAGIKEDRSKPCQVASIDSLIRREFPEADVVMVDECHLSYAKKYDRIFEHYADKIFIGYSATPERRSRKESLLKHWEELIKSLTIEEAVAIGANVPPIVYSIKRNTLNLGKIRTVAGDYNAGQLSLEMRNPKIIALAINEWEKRGENRPTIAFAVDIDHSKKIRDAFIERGISADHIDGTTPEAERLSKFADLREGRTKVLCSVNVLSVGFDEPCVSCILSCRPTKSRLIWIQQVGRGLRLFEGKEDCIILDQAENSFNLMHPLEYVPPGLKEANLEKIEAPCKECPECGVLVPNFTKVCPNCGYVFPPPKKETSHGDMDQVSAKIRNSKLREQRDFFINMLKVAIVKDFSPDYASVKFKEKYGMFPNTLIKRHAIFEKTFEENDQKDYVGYLLKIAERKNKDQAWVKRHLSSEFGKIIIEVY